MAINNKRHIGDELRTPRDLIDRLNAVFSFTLDPAADDENHLCDKYYTIETNGLAHSWEGERAYVNPPYSRGQLALWVNKAIKETTYYPGQRKTVVVMLIPGDSSTKVGQVVLDRASAILYLNRRLAFDNGDGSEEHNSAKFSNWVVLISSAPDYRDIENLRALDLGVV
jgi:phage N-6-adenine-methyltransferase